MGCSTNGAGLPFGEGGMEEREGRADLPLGKEEGRKGRASEAEGEEEETESQG